MSLEQWALAADIVGGAGVIASLIYLAVEIRRQSRLNRLSAARDLSAQWSDLMQTLNESPEMSEIWLRGTADFDSLAPVEKLRFGTYFGRFLKNAEALYLHLLNKTLEPMVWRGTERTIRDLMNQRGSQQWWETRKHWYTDSFQDLVDNLIGDADARALFERYKT